MGPTCKTDRPAATAAGSVAPPPAAAGSRVRVNDGVIVIYILCLRAAQTFQMLKQLKRSAVESIAESELSFGPRCLGMCASTFHHA